MRYGMFSVDLSGYKPNLFQPASNRELNRLAKKGWRVVGIINATTKQMTLLLSKKKWWFW